LNAKVIYKATAVASGRELPAFGNLEARFGGDMTDEEGSRGHAVWGPPGWGRPSGGAIGKGGGAGNTGKRIFLSRGKKAKIVKIQMFALHLLEEGPSTPSSWVSNVLAGRGGLEKYRWA